MHICGGVQQALQCAVATNHSHLHELAANRLAGADGLSRVFGCGNREAHLHLHLHWIWMRGKKMRLLG